MLKNSQRGIGMIELLLVIALFSIIMTLGFSSYRVWQRKILLINSRDQIKSSLVKAQQLATAAADTNSWGVHFETSTYAIFVGETYDDMDPNNEIWVLDGVEIQNASSLFSDAYGVYGPDVVFSKFSGEANNTGTIPIILSIDPSYTKSIEVRSPGQID